MFRNEVTEEFYQRALHHSIGKFHEKADLADVLLSRMDEADAIDNIMEMARGIESQTSGENDIEVK